MKEDQETAKLILKKMADDHDRHDHQQRTSSSTSLLRTVREIDFFDEHKPKSFLPLLKENHEKSQQEILVPDIVKPPAMSPPPSSSSPPKKRLLCRVQDTDDHHHQETSQEILFPNTVVGPAMLSSSSSLPPKKRPVQETDDMHLHQETTLTFTDASTDCRYVYVQKKTTKATSIEGVPRMIRLFGVNLIVRSDSTGSVIDDDDDDQKKKAESKTKGKEKIVDGGDQESKLQTFLMPSASRTKSIMINETKNIRKNTEKPSCRRKSKNPNVVHHQEQEAPAPVAPPPLFHPRILQEIQPVSLFEKKLQFSDVASGQNRLFITRSEDLMGFLTEEERKKVEDRENYLLVVTNDIQGYEYTMHLTKWHAVDMIVLKHEWCKLVIANRLQKGDSVQGRGYRRGDEFRLAIDVIRKEE